MWARLFLPLAAFVAILFFFTPSTAVPQGTIHQEQSLYRNIYVTQRGDELCMVFRAQRALGRESCKLLSDPDRLVFQYTRMAMSGLYVVPRPRRILIVGLGGGSVPSALQEMMPDAKIDVVEIDDAVYRIAREYFEFAAGPNMRVFIEDGRVFVRRAASRAERYDLVFLDAFEDDYIPEHMLTQEFLEEVRAIMTPDGAIVANTFSASALYDHESVTYHAVFGPFFNLKFGNRVIVGKLGGLPSDAELRENSAVWAAALEPRNVVPDFFLTLMDRRTDWDPNARILTDQYSPSNVLNAMERGS